MLQTPLPQPSRPTLVPIYWSGLAKRYKFQLDQIGAIYRPIPGVYIFCRLAPNGRWNPVYVGETDNLFRRLTDQLRLHHCWQRICVERATHISTLHVPGADALRLMIETDLRRSLNPPCNRQ
jgi:hypothetical protein